jgi:predicted MFS family arabinose efflux permease
MPIIIIAAALAFPGLRHLGTGTSAAHNWRRSLAALGLAGGAGLLVSGLAAHGLAQILGLIGAGLILGLPALRRLAPEGTLRASAGVPAAIVTCGLLNMAFFGVDAFVPLGLTEVRGQSPTAAGLALTAATLTWTTGAWLQARLASRQGRRQLTRAGLMVAAAGIVAAAALLLPAVPALLAPAAWGVAGLGMGLGYSTLSLVVLEGAESGQEGTATAALQMMNVLGSALGTGIGGVIVAHANARGAGPGAGIAQQDLAMLGVIGLALIATRRLPGQTRKP